MLMVKFFIAEWGTEGVDNGEDGGEPGVGMGYGDITTLDMFYS